ncbi:unnamed protein product [Orchesella dallaii]|uniref:Uncharacterized protein n=1 Tax=Orchesella dallaii TaxID=48710 RepID=A0ABP1S932_9HEXA
MLKLNKFFFEATCKNIGSNWASTLTQKNSDSYPVNWFGQWLQILRRYNYTITFIDNQIDCRNEHYTLHKLNVIELQGEAIIIQLDNRIYPIAVSHPLALEDPNRKMGFIACGSAAMQAFPFRDFFWVFDWYVWACLIIFNWTIMPIIMCVMEWLSESNQTNPSFQQATQKSVFLSRVFFQPVIILLEQGSAFTTKHLSNAATRWVAAALILVAVVLSNSYKYDNGNQMFSIGKEILLERNIGMALSGWFSSHLTNTLGWLADFGLWKHARNMYEKNVTSVADTESHKSQRSSQITGNVLMVFVTFLCGHTLAASSPIVKDLKNHISTYDGFKVHSLEGLGEFLQPFQHCLIHMTNFGGVDLPGLAVASIQRKTKLAVCYDTIYAISSSLEIRHNKTSARRYRLSCYETIPKCPISRLFGDSKCVGLNFRRFVTRIRPWTCEVIISLYQKQIRESQESSPLHYIEQTESTLSVFEEDEPLLSLNRYVHRSIPSYAPINILITEEEDFFENIQTLEAPNAVGAWFTFSLNNQMKLDWHENRISRDAYFVAITQPLAFTWKHYVLHNVSCTFAVQMKLALGKFEIHLVRGELLLKQLGFVRTRQENKAEINQIFHISSIIDILYTTVFFKHDSALTRENFLYESFCKSMYFKVVSDSPQKRGELYIVNWIGEWLQILRRYNYTILMDFQYIICNTNSIKLELLEFAPRFLGYEGFVGDSSIIQLEEHIYPIAVPHPLALDDPIRKMGFISCGSSSVLGLPFRELFRVFDSYVWACLFIINLIVMPIILCIVEWLSDQNHITSDPPDASQKGLFSSRMFFQPVIILLEQGGAFTNKHLNTAAVRWVAAALLLVAIVLSNSYKYDNVYNMMLPRTTAPLWFFEQLVAEKFSLYTRTNFFTFGRRIRNFSDTKNYSGLPSELSGHANYVVDKNSHPYILYSELINIYDFEARYLDFLNMQLLSPWQKDGSPNNGSHQVAPKLYRDVFRKLLKNTKLLKFENTLSHYSTFDNTLDTEQDFLHYMKEFDSKQANHFMQILNECQNTAFVLPFGNIVNLFANLRNQGDAKLTIGKEVLLERNIGMALHGWISNHLISTLGWLQDFGYWKHVRNIYWENITSISHVTSDYTHQTSQISGNILVIFVTLMCGHSLAAISYIFEIRKQVYVKLAAKIKSIYIGMEKIWSRSPVFEWSSELTVS